MKNLAVLVALALSATLFLHSCLAPRVETAALFAPAQLAWPEVEVDYFRGLDDGLSEGDLTDAAADNLRGSAVEMRTALEEKSRDKLRLVPWVTMKPWATRGIDDALAEGELGPTVAESAREHLATFDETITRLRSR